MAGERARHRTRVPVLAGLLAAAPAFAQNVPNIPAVPAVPTAPNTTTLAPIQADQTGQLPTSTTPAWMIVPRVSVSETVTDNVVTGSANPQSDNVTQLSPGFRIAGRGARINLNADYSLNELRYARDSSRNQHQNALNASGSLEAIEKWLFVDFGGNIGQQAISAFGPLSTSNANINPNQTETSSFRFSPYIRGLIGRDATYDLRYSQVTTRSKAEIATDSEVKQWIGRVGGATRFASLGWAINLARDTNHISNGTDSEDKLANFELNYRFSPEFSFGVNAGHDSQNLTSVQTERGSTSGVRVAWTPSERTSLLGSAEKRSFGDTHNLSFNHRMPLSAWRYTDTRNVTLVPNQLTRTSLGSTYDLIYAQLASSFPDPAARAQQTNDILRQTGISPNAEVTSGFLASRASLERRQELSLVLIGKRNTVTYALTRTEQDALGVSTGARDDFSNNSTVRQRGFSSNWAFQLSAYSTIAVLSSSQKSTGDGAGTSETTRNTWNLNFTTRLGAKAYASMTAVRNNFKSTTAPYDEHTLVGTVTMQY